MVKLVFWGNMVILTSKLLENKFHNLLSHSPYIVNVIAYVLYMYVLYILYKNNVSKFNKVATVTVSISIGVQFGLVALTSNELRTKKFTHYDGCILCDITIFNIIIT